VGRDSQAEADVHGAQAAVDTETVGGAELGRHIMPSTATGMLIALEGQKGAQDLQRQQLVGQLMGDQAFGVPNPLLFNPQQAGMQGALSGGAAGFAQAAGSFFGTDAGQQWLKGLGAKPIPTPTVDVSVAGPKPIPTPTVGIQPIASGPFTHQGQFHYQPVLSYAQPMPPSPWQWGQPRLVP
jgi:hypothetical protein